MTSEGASNFVQPLIPKFDGDYEHWSLLIENLLRSKDYWSVIEAEIPLETKDKKTLEEIKLKDLRAKNYLFASLDKVVLKTISKRETAKQLWESMREKYQGNARVQKAQLQRLKREFEVLMMKHGESITDYFSRIIQIANEMRNCGGNMSDTAIVEKILRTLTEKWNFVVCSIEESKDTKKMTVDELMSSLMAHELKFKNEKDEYDEQVLQVRCDGGCRSCCRGRASSRGRGRGRTPWSKSTVECYKCHKFGHYQDECEEINYAEINKKEELLLISQVDLTEDESLII